MAGSRMRAVVAVMLCGSILLGLGGFTRAAHAARARQASGDLVYAGGPVMKKVSVYSIFWLPQGTSFAPAGSGTSDADYMGIVNNFLLDVGGSDWFGVLTQYTGKSGHIQNSVKAAGSVVDTRPYPKQRGSRSNPLLDSDLHNEVIQVMKAQHWTNQKLQSIFMVFTASGIQSCEGDPSAAPTSCTFSDQNGYCGYHSYFTYQKKPVVYVNAPDLYDGGNCDVNDPTTADNSPNSDPAADIQVNNIAHELAESATDPLLNAWGSKGDSREVGDLCDQAFPPRDANGGDISFSNNDEFYVQALYSNKDGGCVVSLGGQLVQQGS